MVNKKPGLDPPLEELGVFALVFLAWGVTLEGWRDLLRLALFPALMSTLFVGAWLLVIGPVTDLEGYLAINVLALVPQVPFLVAWQRHVLIAPKAATDPPLLWGRREGLSLLYILLIIVVTAVVDILLTDIASRPLAPDQKLDLYRFMEVPLDLVLSSIFAFVFPAIAVDAGRGPLAAFRQVQGVLPQIMAIYLILGLPAFLLCFAVSGLVNAIFDSWFSFALGLGLKGPGILADVATSYFLNALLFTGAALAFERRTGWRDPNAPKQALKGYGKD